MLFRLAYLAATSVIIDPFELPSAERTCNSNSACKSAAKRHAAAEMIRRTLVYAAVAAAFTSQHRLRAPPRRRATIRMLFLEEAKLEEDALIWAKDASRTRSTPMVVAVALYDDENQCVYVGGFDDAALAVAALCRKHGRRTCKGMRYEDFTAAREGGEEEEFQMMRQSIVTMWLDQATEENGGSVPVGNTEEDWASYDPTSNPFLAGVLGSGEAQEGYDLLTEEELAAEKLQQRRENMKRNLDDAVRTGDEALATKLLRRIQKLDDNPDAAEEDDEVP